MTQKVLTNFFENLHKEVSVESFHEIYADDIRFKDPFKDVRGVDEVHNVFAHMYRNLVEPKFIILEYLSKEHIIYVKWEFHFAFNTQSETLMFEGVSRLMTNHEGKITEHIDYWDAAEHMYEKMPFIGGILRFVKRKIVQS